MSSFLLILSDVLTSLKNPHVRHFEHFEESVNSELPYPDYFYPDKSSGFRTTLSL